MTAEQLWAALEYKLRSPAGGLANQRLTTDGFGGVYWAGNTTPVAAERLNIGGAAYTLRTGTEGAPGYLTISADAIWLGTQKVKPYLDGKEITDIYLAANLVYSIGTGEYDVYYNSYQHGIAWKVNPLPRPNYTRYANSSLAYANQTDGYLWLYLSVNPNESSYTHNTHVMTENPVTVPKRATKMHIQLRGTQNGMPTDVRFGLLPSNAATSYSTANGGVLSANNEIRGTEWQEKTLVLPDNIIGADNLHAIINASGVPPQGSVYGVRVARVWFD